MPTPTIDYPPVVSRSEWLKDRKKLLAREKELTKARDRLNADRRRLPMVEIDKSYVFEGPQGKISLLDLFDGRHQLIVYHFMWLWKNKEPLERGCPSCSSWTNEIGNGLINHLHMKGTSLCLISRAPLSKIEPFKKRMGWNIPWFSSFGSDFNFDFQASFDESVAALEYNYRSQADHEKAGTGYYFKNEQPFDLPGVSCFLRKGDQIFHTYSTYGRGDEGTIGSYAFLDLTALGRQEEWEEPKGRITGLGAKAGSEIVNRLQAE